MMTHNYDFEKIYSNIKKMSYKYIGSGSGRVVFDLGDGNVVKVAKNQRGIAQNEEEYNISEADDSDLFAKIICKSEKSKFLVMEKAEKISSMVFVWRYFNVKSNSSLYQVDLLKDICKKNSLEIRDFGRSVNWGKISDKPVIVDFGFTRKVRIRYYSSLFSRIMYRRFG